MKFSIVINTHNQKKSTSKDKQIVEKLDRDYVWGIYHQKNSNLWVYEILQKVKYKVAKNGADIEKNDVFNLRKALKAADLEYVFKLNFGDFKFYDVSYFDDVAIPLVADNTHY